MGPKSSLFFQHVLRFLKTHCGQIPSQVVVGVSGGVDSRLLLEWVYWLKSEGFISSVRAMGVDHRSRPEQRQELALMEKVCQARGIPWLTLSVAQIPKINKEEMWRLERLGVMKSQLQAEEVLFTGHHLDDSWEWSMLQQARSSEVQSGLGIPLKSGRLWHPFLCVSRAQIHAEARRRQLEWCEDPTNQLPNYARALFRQKLAPQIKQQHPQFLKHYAQRSQRLAEKLGLSLIKSEEARCVRGARAHLYLSPPSEAQLLLSVRALSQTSRGTLYREIPKILAAQKQGKQGPYRLSGGVSVVCFGEWLMVSGEGFRFQLPERQTGTMRKLTRSQFERLLEQTLSRNDLRHAPFWCGYDPQQRSNNTLVATGRDAVWKSLTKSPQFPVISAQKLLARWKNPQQVLVLSPLWPLQGEDGQD